MDEVHPGGWGSAPNPAQGASGPLGNPRIGGFAPKPPRLRRAFGQGSRGPKAPSPARLPSRLAWRLACSASLLARPIALARQPPGFTPNTATPSFGGQMPSGISLPQRPIHGPLACFAGIGRDLLPEGFALSSAQGLNRALFEPDPGSAFRLHRPLGVFPPEALLGAFGTKA